MIRESIDRILEIGGASKMHADIIEGFHFHVNGTGAKQIKLPSMPTTSCFSLTQLVNLIKSQIDHFEDHKALINVEDHQNVVGIHELVDANGETSHFGRADFSDVFSSFDFGKQHEHEEFMIALLTKFERDDALNEMLELVSSVKVENGAQSDDDGVCQTVATKAGVHLTNRKQVKQLWDLRTYKTFPEVEQPVIKYMLRLHNRAGGMPKFALYECDGGRWKVECTKMVREWLVNRLKGELGDKADRVIVL